MEITDKTWVVGIRGLFKEYITEDRAQRLINYCKQKTNDQLIELEGVGLIPIKGLYIIKTSFIESENKTKRGDYKCKYDYWHGRNEDCGHGLLQS